MGNECSQVIYDRLMDLDGEPFIRNLYYEILQREPDQDGFDYFMSRLNQGTMSKEDIVCSIGLSEEAVKKGIRVNGVNIIVNDKIFFT